MDHHPALPRWSPYDVFLSFRGEDTRNTFTGHLYNALCDKGITTFIDDHELRKGEGISPALVKAIQESRISIIIFSENYAFSAWCLDELVKILECQKTKGQIVCPVFYNVEPSQVRKLTGSFQEAFAVHKEKMKASSNKIKRWKEALHQAGSLSGWHLQNGNESTLIRKIVEDVSSILNRKFLNVAKYPVHLDYQVHEVTLLLSLPLDDVQMLGIHGVGGIGKTTISKATYNLLANQYEGCAFIADVREIAKQHLGLVQLQETLLQEILRNNDIKVRNVDAGVVLIRQRLSRKKVIIVLDDVDDAAQLDALAGDCDWFGPGSRIIVTTRNQHLLVAHGVEKIYNVQKLDDGDALQLLCWHAFRKPSPPKQFEWLSHSVVKYCKGLPLALTVLGSFLCGRNILQWKNELQKLEKLPNKKVYDVLKVSFDGLDDHEKGMFLDIACFFKGKEKDYVTDVLEGSGFNSIIGLQVLAENSLINIEYGKVQMHDLLQQMGREIVRQESPKEPGRRTRIWSYEDVLHVLQENTGTDEIEAIMIDLPKSEGMWLTSEAFCKMKRLRLLMVRNAHIADQGLQCSFSELRCLDWHGYTLASIPPNFLSQSLALLYISDSKIERLDFGFKKFGNMKRMDFSNCRHLVEIPDLSTAPSLEKLILRGCSSLSEVHQSVGFLDKLVLLDLHSCFNLRFLPRTFRLKSLQKLILSRCSRLKVFPDIAEEMHSLTFVNLDETGISCLPESIEYLTGLRYLILESCKSLIRLPSTIFKLQNLQNLNLSGCTKLGEIPELPRTNWESIETCSGFSCIVLSNATCSLKLDTLDFTNCRQLPNISGNNLAYTLLTQGLLQRREITIILPGSEYPEWFSLRSEESSLSFCLLLHCLEKLAGLATYVVFELEKEVVSGYFSCELAVFVNGKRAIHAWSMFFFKLESKHVWLAYYPRSWLRDVEKRLSNDFDVQFSIRASPKEWTNVNLKGCGVHAVCELHDDQGNDPTMIKYICPLLSSEALGDGGIDIKGELEEIAQPTKRTNDESYACDKQKKSRAE